MGTNDKTTIVYFEGTDIAGHLFAPRGGNRDYFRRIDQIIGDYRDLAKQLNALGKISGRGNTGLNVIYESHKNAMYTGFGLIVGFYILAEILLRR